MSPTNKETVKKKKSCRNHVLFLQSLIKCMIDERNNQRKLESNVLVLVPVDYEPILG